MDVREAINKIYNHVVDVHESGAFELTAVYGAAAKAYVAQIAAESVNTWSAAKPPYAFTPLCPDLRYRPGGELYQVMMRRDKPYIKSIL